MPAIHNIDPETNMATDCAMLNAPWHVAYSFDLQPSPGKKCCAPELDCHDCRVGPVATFTLLAKLTREMRKIRCGARAAHRGARADDALSFLGLGPARRRSPGQGGSECVAA